MFQSFVIDYCHVSEQHVIASSDGRHAAKSSYRECRAASGRAYSFFDVYLSRDDEDQGYDRAPTVMIREVIPHQASVIWDNPNQLSIYYPAGAVVEAPYVRTFTIDIVSHPEPDSSTK